MKTFLKMLLAVVLGGGLLFFLLFIMLVSIASLSETKAPIPKNAVLKISLNNQFTERAKEDPFQDLDALGFSSQSPVGILSLKSALKKAESDDNIKGVFLSGGFPMAGHASLKEIHAALKEFKASGKFIYGYSEILSQKGLFLSTAADTFFVNPEGYVEWNGLSASVMYYQDALAKIGLNPEVLRASGNRFKSAVEPFLRQDMSPENRMQLDQLIGGIWKVYLKDMSLETGLSTEELNDLANNFNTSDPKIALSNKLIKATAYYDQAMEAMARELDVDEIDDINFISMSKYDKNTTAKNGSVTGDKIAVIIAQGDIVDGKGDEYSIGSVRISKAIRKARLNDKVKAVVLRVNSPGGSALASEVIWREMDLLKDTKPVVVSMGDLAASGGYYISAFADTIVAQENTITGSIGAFGLFFTGEELMHDKLGLNIETVKTNEYSDLGTFDRSLTESEKTMMIAQVDRIYSTFKSRVAEGRGLSVEYVDSVGQGRVWTGSDAKELGLVDVLGNLNDAIDIAKNMANLEDDVRIVEYPELKDPWLEIIEGLGGSVEAYAVKNQLGEYARYFNVYKKVESMQGFQTRLEYDLVVD